MAMMHQVRKFNLSVIKDPSMQVLELRYHGGLSMYIMLPDNDLSQVSNHFCSHCWGIRRHLGPLTVFLSINFKISGC